MGKIFIYSPKRPDRLWKISSLTFIQWGFFLRFKARGTWSWPLNSSSRVLKNA